MATNFFAAQDQARSNTRLLVLLFGLALLGLLLLTNLLLILSLGLLEPEQAQQLMRIQDPHWVGSLPWALMGWVSALLCLVIVVVVAIKQAQLNQGGQVIAKALGGRLIEYHLADDKERRLLNVVEEMAIAACVPVPPVYLLPEESINAFAAGYSSADAVIGVTQGSLDQLNRDQLQGVIAHEFSHILNGDMRLNIRLMALLHGIEFIGHSGYFLLRSMSRTRAAPIRSSKSKDNAGAMLGLALGLIVLGYLGTFFGSLIKAAVSRQREYLADASAVQFTRNPAGLAGALKAIAAAAFGSRIMHPKADEISHLFFSEALSRWSNLFATHPPLQQRIKRLEPDWDATEPARAQAQHRTAEADAPAITARAERISETLLAALPALLLDSSRNASSAPALCCACLLQAEQLPQQWAVLNAQADPLLLQQLQNLYPQLSALSGQQKLQLLQLAVPGLKQLSRAQFAAFEQLCQSLSHCDGAENLLEWAILSWLRHCVGSQFDTSLLHRRDQSSTLADIQHSALVLLSLCADQAIEPHARQQAWHVGLQQLALEPTTARPEVSFTLLTAQLPALIHSAPLLKQQLWQMVSQAVKADQLVNEQEQMLLQALALLLELPVSQEPSLLRS